MSLRTVFLLLLIWVPGQLLAQTAPTYLSGERFSIHAQTTVINQFKPAFTAPYSGPNSLSTAKESQTSITSTFFLGMRLWKGASLHVNPEIAGGSGLSQVLGIAAATNGETFRIGNPAPKIYLARLFFRQIIPLSRQTTNQESDINVMGGPKPERYLAFTVGKIGAADYFDVNRYSHDPRTQFMSWALMSNGAWDYPANTRGYTPSAVAEYVSPKHELRYSFSLVPLIANGNAMNWDIRNAGSHTLEYTHNHTLGGRAGAVRALGFFTTTNMGSYRESLALNPEQPVIEATRRYGHTKYGVGFNVEQELTANLGAFFRASWNDGHNETWVFTEIDRSVSGGLVMQGTPWKRKEDNLGLAFVASGLSGPHRDYLAAGGQGFMLGDGRLNYGSEHLTELYYRATLVPRRLFLSGAYQLVTNPGYNRDRHGPVQVFSVRLHARV